MAGGLAASSPSLSDGWRPKGKAMASQQSEQWFILEGEGYRHRAFSGLCDLWNGYQLTCQLDRCSQGEGCSERPLLRSPPPMESSHPPGASLERFLLTLGF